MRCILLLLGFSVFGCQNQTNSTTDPVKESTPAEAQVILKTQTIPFNIAEKSEVKTDYQHLQEVVVPANLAPQNKWVMFEGPVLENELVAYRFYMDNRHRSDIYGKLVPDLVMDTVGWDYHDIMDWGSDILKVGNSLGIGSPAIYFQDSVYALSDHGKKTVTVLQGKGETAAVRFTFEDLKIGNQALTIEQDWSLKTGQPHSTVALKITKGQLPTDAFFATGVVKHLPQATSGTNGNQFYLYSWGKQSFHEENLGMGVLASTQYQPEVIENELSHLVVFKNSSKGVVYDFAAAWEKDVMGIKDATAFQKRLLSKVVD
jgi:hypothetical protein